MIVFNGRRICSPVFVSLAFHEISNFSSYKFLQKFYGSLTFESVIRYLYMQFRRLFYYNEVQNRVLFEILHAHSEKAVVLDSQHLLNSARRNLIADLVHFLEILFLQV